MNSKPIKHTKLQQAVDHLRNNLHLLEREASDLPLTIASRATWQNALTYMRANPHLHCAPRHTSRYYAK